VTYPLNAAQIRLAFRLLGQQHHLDASSLAERVRQEGSLNSDPAERERGIEALSLLASLVQGDSLGREDFHQVLAEQSQLRLLHSNDYSPELEAALREGLGFPPRDPEGVRLDFRRRGFEDSQVSWVSLTPERLDPAKPPLLFVTGLHHPSAVYLAHLASLARRDQRRVVSVDLPSMGGSVLARNASVYAADLHRAVLSCVQEEFLMGQRFDLMAHSLGTVPAREIEAEARGNADRNFHGRILGRVVLVAPVPTEEDRQLGDRLAPSYAWQVIGGLLAHGRIAPDRLNELFFQNHPASDQIWLNRLVERESYSSSLWGALSAFLSAYRYPSLARVGEDENLRIVLPGEDALFRLENPEAWRNRRGIYWVESADHSFIAGPQADSRSVEILQRALNEGLDPAQAPFSRSEAFRHLRSASFGALGGSSAGLFGLQLRLAARTGLAVAGPLGVDLEGGIQNFAGMDAAEGGFAWRPQASLDVGLSLLSGLPLRIFAGAYGEADAASSIQQGDFVGEAGATGGFQVNFEGTLVFRTHYQHPLWRSQAQEISPLGEFWFHLGAAF